MFGPKPAFFPRVLRAHFPRLFGFIMRKKKTSTPFRRLAAGRRASHTDVMYLLENPVLQRELLVNLRSARSFALLFVYNALLGLVVVLAWPKAHQLDLTRNPEEAKSLVNLFFLSQYVLTCLMAPSFAAAAITGEKERKTYEMLLASPLKPGAIVLGKLFASLAHLGILVFSSLPIVMLCLPLGGVSFYEVLATYLALAISIVTFGMISVACSSYFRRTASSLAVSYLLILPLALAGILVWNALSAGSAGQLRLLLSVTAFPAICATVCIVLFRSTARRLLYPPDVGSEGSEVVDIDQETREAVGMVIQRDQFPDRLFAPAKRTTLLSDHANPVYDKEMRSEIFAQGTLMLRLVIQASMLLAIPLMAVCLFWRQELIAWYFCYVAVFNVLVSPVFSAGAISGERERQTLDLLLTTIVSPWQILWGKFLASLRVSGVLTVFLLWPVFLACLMPGTYYWSNLPAVAAMFAVVALCCVTTTTLGLFCSMLFRKTSQSMMATYLVILALFCLPIAARFFGETFFPQAASANAMVLDANATSPFAAFFATPLVFGNPDIADHAANWPLYIWYVGFSTALVAFLLTTMLWLFNVRCRVAE